MAGVKSFASIDRMWMSAAAAAAASSKVVTKSIESFWPRFFIMRMSAT